MWLVCTIPREPSLVKVSSCTAQSACNDRESPWELLMCTLQWCSWLKSKVFIKEVLGWFCIIFFFFNNFSFILAKTATVGGGESPHQNPQAATIWKWQKVSDMGWQNHWHFTFRVMIPNSAHSAPGLYVQTTDFMYRYAKHAVWPKHRERIGGLPHNFFVRGSHIINRLFMHFYWSLG